MRSPSDMQTIQIDITNACDKRCSNCTRFCGNHQKPFFMDYETFRRAMDSLEGYDGVIGIMGGEPTLHPEFERFVDYVKEKFGRYKGENRLICPQKEFIKEIRRREFDSHVLRQPSGKEATFKMSGPGLWSNMGSAYYDKYELIQDTFGVQFLNDHINPSYHQPGLVSRKDLGIPDSEWIPMRDSCWIQNEWSAAITPKGCFFCEVAGALDMLFNGPGGWQIEPGWWERSPSEFGDQIQWCEICGFAIDTFMRDAAEETDDVSPSVYEMLKKVNSPKLRSGHINQIVIRNGQIAAESKVPKKQLSKAQPFIREYEDRFNAANSSLFIHDYDEVYIAAGKKFGIEFNRALKNARNWILFYTNDDGDKSDMEKLISNCVMNPGTLHLGNGVALFSKKALSLRKYGFDRIAHASSFQNIINGWIPEKVINIYNFEEKNKPVRRKIMPDKKYALWGTGIAGSNLLDIVVESGAVLTVVVDADEEKTGRDFYGHTIHRPAYLADHNDEFDYLLMGHYSRFAELYRQASRMGIKSEKIIFPYEV